MVQATEELVVLVDEDDREIGTMPKRDVHTAETPLHRGFSVFLFQGGRLLTQQRSRKKVTWPLMWSNSVCGHPLPGEPTPDAVRRRAAHELGLDLATLEFASPYRYRFERRGVVENEICPIFVGEIANTPQINTDEVEDIRWLGWRRFLDELSARPDVYSEWCREEAAILEGLGIVRRFDDCASEAG